MKAIFCSEGICAKPAEGTVWLHEIAGTGNEGSFCRDHALEQYDRLRTRYSKALVEIGWVSCKRCGGDGSIDGKGCGDCIDLTEAGGPLHFGDFIHLGLDVALYVARYAGPDDDGALAFIGPPQYESPATVDINIHHWDRCGGPSPCNHPLIAEEAT